MLEAMEGHISDEELASWAEGALPPERVATHQPHLASCDTCRRLLSELTRGDERAATLSLGRYELREKVGVGGMGTVWAAWDQKLGRRVAVKVAHIKREAAGERFLYERQILAGLEHPNIARLLDAGETADGRPWFAMDFVDGLPLDQYCSTRRLGVRERVKLMLPVIAAVEHAHQHLVVHRDLKPANILVDEAGQPHLLDFGIAFMLEHDVRLTATGQTPMTPAWASPEQVLGQNLTVRTDIYSLGVVLYELLTGVSPYGSTTSVAELLGAVRDASPVAMSVAAAARGQVALARELEGDLDAVVAMALRKETHARYASALALADDLDAALEGRVTQARRGDRRYRFVRFVRRHRLAASSLAAVFTALAFGLTAAAWQAREASQARARADRRFAQVRSLAHAVLFDYHDGIADLPGSTPLRERLVKDALTYLDSLAAESADDVSLQRELAAAYLKVGDVQGDPYGASLGDTDGAAKSYQQSRALAADVLLRAPADREARRTLSLSEEKAGNLDEVAGRLDVALSAYQRAAASMEALVDEQPDDVESRFDLSRMLLGMAMVSHYQNDDERAHALVQRSLSERRAVVSRHKTAIHLTGLSASLLLLSDVEAQRGRLDAAISATEEMLAVTEEALKLDPQSARAKRGHAQALLALGDRYSLRGESDRALANLREAVAEARSDVSRDPQNAVTRRDLIVALDALARTLGRAGEHKDALETVTEAQRLAEALLEVDRSPSARRDVLELSHSEGVEALAANELERAAAAFTRSRTDAAKLLEEDPKNPRVRDSLVAAHRGLSDVALARREPKAALTELDLALAALARETEADAGLREVEPGRARLLVAKAAVLAKLSRPVDACTLAREALAVLEPAAQHATASPELGGDLARATALCAPPKRP